MITLFSDNKEIETNFIQFSDGAITYKVNTLPNTPRYISFSVCPSTPVYRVREELEMITDTVLSNDEVDFTNTKWYLNLPYLPYGRADRRFEKGNPLPLLNFLSWLRDDMIYFDEIFVCDIHNPAYVLEEFVGLNITHKTQLECFRDSLPDDFTNEYDFVVAPDKGAVKKAETIACYLGLGVYNCGKERDVSTGAIIRSTLPNINFSGKKVLIPDDLMDGGYTFIKLAEQLKEKGALQVDLYVTHLIASKGLEVFKGLIDNVYFHHTVGNYLTKENVWGYND